MKRATGDLWMLGGLVAGILGLAVIAGQGDHRAPVRTDLASSVVYIHMGDDAHGSGVHIGGGYVLTAAHVADNQDVVCKHEDDKVVCAVDEATHKLSVEDSNGGAHNVEVMWVNHDYDVALIKIDFDASKLASSPLACRAPKLGERVSFAGNPIDMHDITTFGQVARSQTFAEGPWASVTAVAAAVIPGMSGGPAFDDEGNVVGINVGTFTGFALGLIVPGSTICKLMDR